MFTNVPPLTESPFPTASAPDSPPRLVTPVFVIVVPETDIPFAPTNCTLPARPWTVSTPLLLIVVPEMVIPEVPVSTTFPDCPWSVTTASGCVSSCAVSACSWAISTCAADKPPLIFALVCPL